MSLQYLNPKYWFMGLALALLWLNAHLPYGFLIREGIVFGWLMARFARKLRRVARVNLELCFPALTKKERAALVSHSLRELGVSIAETTIVWFRDHRKFLQSRYTIEGSEFLAEAVKQNRGIIFLSSHYGSVDLNGALLAELDRGDRKFIGTFRKTDEFVNRFLDRARGKYCDAMYSSKDQRNVVRVLKQGHVLWYAPDIEARKKSSVFVDFMGAPALTTTAISRVSRITNAIVLPVGHYRINDKPEYKIKIFPPLQDFPTDDPAADTQRVNHAIEAILEPHPERYWWVIKRFKRLKPRGRRKY